MNFDCYYSADKVHFSDFVDSEYFTYKIKISIVKVDVERLRSGTDEGRVTTGKTKTFAGNVQQLIINAQLKFTK